MNLFNPLAPLLEPPESKCRFGEGVFKNDGLTKTPTANRAESINGYTTTRDLTVWARHFVL